jgi:site-specific recombinase XerC
MHRLDRLFEQFLRERTYIQNVTAATREWYESAWKAFKRAHANPPDRAPTAALISKADLQQFVIHERERGIRPVTCNTWLRALNAFCRWLHEQGELPALVKLAPQRREKRLIRTQDLAALLNSRPKTFAHWRVHALISTIRDSRVPRPHTRS